ncbi:uncharacterized protein FFUJ_05241 [Fusarium fujikuroi IMI 58289]|uniref:Uncharacterized protein n=1 Tax=Gibberella fujikuroi (strain CBS 195.34 / IMI 58289 / NRRL A-6831) TaxID=1279085 RepID=S0DMF8_GIBF5|nr:uncharacterized protein FFUJ_05241 [Fusarium fujikuroi IMI 58289]QGI59885.1 hypothetical protein CEK27_003856 [Fusarium fujikuroi]QGI77089.1 hypothetical protein CEK25_003818 [Fusarium fujikuroi]QGI90798.1 hypothetical protein CEK26_003867 [Fusarium fujikuroi]CCT63611.1 uncharacterized protein FFUJ_05241 [Fusarium fujikuroi IMI 58289]SCN90907.1 uncharacterized protein FFE2_07135 [Fusarium fujikuroi]
MDPEALAWSINDETVDVHGIGVDVCRNVPLHHISPAMIHRLHKAIAADIFHSMGIQRSEAGDCFGAMIERITSSRLLHHSKLEDCEAIDFIRQSLIKVIRLHTQTGKIVCPPAHIMGCLIAAIAYRKLQPVNEEFFQNNEDLVKVFGEHNGIQWLSVAIQVFAEVGPRVFIIELDEACLKPVSKLQILDGISSWVVTTRMPQVNRFEGVISQFFGLTHRTPSPVYPKLEPHDRPLLSVEPDDIPNSPISLNEDDEMEDTTITLHDYTRQMNSLGKRLATPDRATVKRIRREILKNPDQSQATDQHVDVEELLRFNLEKNIKHAVKEAIADVRQTQEYFDTYSRYKDVWMICVRQQGGVPESLRDLVKHHCTPSQVFHLLELEKEHLAKEEVEVEV